MAIPRAFLGFADSRVVPDRSGFRPAEGALRGVTTSHPPPSRSTISSSLWPGIRKKIEIVPDDSIAIDRTLVADRFREATGYTAPH